jgi:hypothetical protein
MNRKLGEIEALKYSLYEASLTKYLEENKGAGSALVTL